MDQNTKLKFCSVILRHLTAISTKPCISAPHYSCYITVSKKLLNCAYASVCMYKYVLFLKSIYLNIVLSTLCMEVMMMMQLK